jgi:hypothetical protein
LDRPSQSQALFTTRRSSRNFIPESVADLQSPEYMDRGGRHSPQAEQDETGGWCSSQQTKGK